MQHTLLQKLLPSFNPLSAPLVGVLATCAGTECKGMVDHHHRVARGLRQRVYMASLWNPVWRSAECVPSSPKHGAGAYPPLGGSVPSIGCGLRDRNILQGEGFSISRVYSVEIFGQVPLEECPKYSELMTFLVHVLTKLIVWSHCVHCS